MNNKKNIVQTSPLSESHYENWLELWQRYLSLFEIKLPKSTIQSTWQHLLGSDTLVYGFGAWQKNAADQDTLVGITHVILYPNTWNTAFCCCLEDLFVSEVARGQGVGRVLLEQVYDFATVNECNHVYWTTEKDNSTLRTLCDKLATRTHMVQYRKDLL